MEVNIRVAQKEEWKKIADIESICFPPAEAACEETIFERVNTFVENFFVAESDGKIIGYVGGGTTDTPHLPDEMYHNVKLHKPEGKYQTVFSLAVLPEYQIFHNNVLDNLYKSKLLHIFDVFLILLIFF